MPTIDESKIQPPAEAPPEAAPAEAAPKLAPVEWARRKGHASDKGTSPGDWMLAGVLHLRHWVEGDLVTEADFDDAWAELAGLPVR